MVEDQRLARACLATPCGDILVAASAAGVERLWLPGELNAAPPAALSGHTDAGAGLDIAAGAGPDSAQRILTQALVELEEYFSGQREQFHVPVALAAPAGSFRSRALAALRALDYGSTISYTELAAAAGSPRAARAAGSVCAHNPVPIFIPCHRVLPAAANTARTQAGGQAAVGAYRGGAALKAWLLQLEAGVVRPQRRP